ncbi:hypothetical protein BK666_22840 [Pseudomonas frederiksbergensis]|uniref:Uncharacterized protein n=1 Tax=Pseudomonas frederiksbergensis TaxID=104087 RepID=A0A423JY05_9PSED|nr:hypothetical protein [Pseudomonas frederiksbergensis]RON42580.1 hypothetical protein BK666_22840 [Pseudomonas frederiksbergensis]
MDNNPIKAYVTQADSNYIRIKILDKSLITTLLDLGFSSETDASEYTIPTPNNATKATIFTQLQALNICFSSDREWCPAEVFQHLRDLGLLSGGFRKISWTRPNHFTVTDEK